MLKWFRKGATAPDENKNTSGSSAAKSEAVEQNEEAMPHRADNAYITTVIQHTLYHAITKHTFVGSLNGDSDFRNTELPDGVTFASNTKKNIAALQEKRSTGLMFAHVPVAHVAMVASPAAIEFNLRQLPNWEPSKLDDDGMISEFKARIDVDQPDFTAMFQFTATQSSRVRVEPKGSDLPGTIMTIAIKVSPK